MRILISDLHELSWCMGRNGAFDTKGIVVFTYGEGEKEMVRMDHISRKRGQVVNAGHTMSAADMDRLAEEWLAARRGDA